MRILLLGLLALFTLTPSCSRSSGGAAGQLLALAAIIQYSQLATQYTLGGGDTYPKTIDSMVLRHTGSEGDVEFDFSDPAGAVVASPAQGVLQPGQAVRIDFAAQGFTYLDAIMTMTCVYAAVLGSNDRLVVPFKFVLNGGTLPALATIMAITAPTVFRHLLTPASGYPHRLDQLVVKNTATSGPAVDYEITSPGPLSGSIAKGRLGPGEEARIDIQARSHNLSLATLSLVMTYAIVASADRLTRSWEFRNAAPPSLAALAVISLISGNSNLVAGLFWPALLMALIGVLVLHSKGGFLNRIPALLYTEIALVGVMTLFMTVALLQASFWRNKTSQSMLDSVHFPPGAGANGYTIHPDNEVDMQAGNYHFFHMTMAASIPIRDAEAKNRHVYAFVMDGDAAPANNWVPVPAFPNDFFKATDRWYQVTYNSQGKHEWRLTVTQVSAGNKTAQVSSAARAIIKDDALVLVVPASEFAVAKPAWRATSFVHQGDFGLNPPHVWSGDLMPPVAAGLNR